MKKKKGEKKGMNELFRPKRESRLGANWTNEKGGDRVTWGFVQTKKEEGLRPFLSGTGEAKTPTKSTRRVRNFKNDKAQLGGTAQKKGNSNAGGHKPQKKCKGPSRIP